MELLRRAWLIALVTVASIGAVCALAMRYELLTPGGTLSAETYNDAFTIHGITMVTALVGAIIAIPTLLLRPSRVTLYVGAAAFIAWAAGTMVLIELALAPSRWTLGPSSPAAATAILALSAVLAAVQIATMVPRLAIPAITAVTALVIISISLLRGELPPRDHLLAACTLSALGVPRSPLFRIAIVPCIAAAWIATIVFHAVHISYLSDTVAAVAPFPALAGAMFAAVLAAKGKTPRYALVLTVGSIATAASFLILGLRGMPARYYQYEGSFQPLQILVGVSFALTIAAAVRMLR